LAARAGRGREDQFCREVNRYPSTPLRSTQDDNLTIYGMNLRLIALGCGCRFPCPCVLLSMVFGRFLGMVRRMESMTCCDFRVVRGLFMASGFVMLRCLPMVFRRDFVMFSRCLMVFCAFVTRHFLLSCLAGFSIPHMLLPIATPRTPS
jgi:hypothetical protein